MRIEDILQRALGTDLLGIHANRLKLVFAATCALLRCSKATLTSIGRAIATGTTHKHGIKRADRLLGNRHVHAERRQMFAAIARKVIAPRSRPVVIVDWTDFSSKMWSLVAAVTFEGRAVTIYSETHPVSRYLKPAVHRAFLQKLRQVVPEGCTPIIPTDAGFRTPWIREVSRLGWDYVCRLRGLTRLREEGRIGCPLCQRDVRQLPPGNLCTDRRRMDLRSCPNHFENLDLTARLKVRARLHQA